MTDYTPGPWEVLTEIDGDTAVISAEVLSPSGGNIAYVNDPSCVDDEVMLANAELIASAPRLKQDRDELLAALGKLLTAYEGHCHLDVYWDPADDPEAKEARELIAKVEK